MKMKKSLLLGAVGISLLSGSAFADGTSPLESVYACALVQNDSERLACYDAAVGNTKQAEDKGEFTTFTRTEAENVQKDAFGFSLPSLPKFAMPSFGGGEKDGVKTDADGQIEEVELAISDIRNDAYGNVLITFENGQVWVQSDSNKVRVSKKRTPTSASVKRAALGSYLIQLSTGERFKAKRVE